jgi:hypothetical protein
MHTKHVLVHLVLNTYLLKVIHTSVLLQANDTAEKTSRRDQRNIAERFIINTDSTASHKPSETAVSLDVSVPSARLDASHTEY